MDQQRRADGLDQGHGPLENRSVDQRSHRRERILRGIELILMMDAQLRQHRDAVDPVVAGAARAGLDPHQIAKFQQAKFRVRIGGLAPRGEHLSHRTIRMLQRSACPE
ncbi:hypothetical protein D3C86_1966040 [compost metagenome]